MSTRADVKLNLFQNVLQTYSLTFYSVCLILSILLIYSYRRRKYYKCNARMRNPPSLPLIGSARIIYPGSAQIVSDLHMYYGLFRSFGDKMAAVFFGRFYIIFCMDASFVYQTLTKILQKTELYETARNLFRDGVVGYCPVSKWKVDRKMIAPSFQHNVLKTYIKIFFEESNILVEKFAPLVENKESFYPGELLNLATFDMVVRSTLGENPRAQDCHDHPVVTAMMDIMLSVQERIFHPFLMNEMVSYILGYSRQEKNYERVVRDYSRSILRRIASGETAENSPSFAAHMLKSNISEEDLVTQINNVMFAGTDTTKTANFAVLLMLALHPDVQNQAYEEVISILGSDKTTQPSYEQLLSMSYIEIVIKESLRLFPPVPLVGRQVVTDGEHQLDGLDIPSGTSIMVSIHMLHRDETYYPNPNAFDPLRFLPAEAAKRPLGSYVPFLVGPRDCLGRKYAMLQIKTVVSTVLRHFKILPSPSCQTMEHVRVEMKTTSRFADNCRILLEPRDL